MDTRQETTEKCSVCAVMLMRREEKDAYRKLFTKLQKPLKIPSHFGVLSLWCIYEGLGLRVGEGGARGVPSCASSRLILALFAGAGQKVAAKRTGE